MDQDLTFSSQNLEAAFQQLEKLLEGDINAAKAKFLHDFVDYFADITNFQAQKVYFENTNVFARIVNLLFTTRPPVLAHVLKLIMVYSRAEINHRYITKINGINMVIKTMQNFPTDFDVQEQACRALINIGTTDKNRKVIAKEGGVEVVLTCLKNGSTSTSLCTAACWCLRNISVDDGNRKLICQQNGLELITKIMQNNATNLQLQTQACWAIENISIKEDAREYVASTGAIKALLTGMRSFPSDRKLQEACCWALSSLATSAKARELIRKDAGIELLMAASKNFPNVEVIQKYVSDAISTITDAGAESDYDELLTPPTPPVDVKNQVNLTVIRKGYMVKQGGRIKTWKKRWFVLDSSKLTYYRDMNEINPLGTISLQVCEGVLEDATTKKNCFMVVTKARTYKMTAPTRHEMAEWMVSVKNVIQELASLNRPRSIEGATYVKEDKENSGAKANTTEKSGTEKDNPQSNFAISPDFFAPEERTPKHELQAVILFQISNAISKSSLNAKIESFENPDLLFAFLSNKIMSEIIQNRLEDTYTKNIRGEKTAFIDALKVDKIVQEIVDPFIQQTLEDHALIERLKKVPRPYRAAVWGTQGVRKTMEDRHIIYPYLNRLIGNETEKEYSIFGIYDGHGGVRAAEYISTHLHVNLINELINPSEESKQGIEVEEGVELTEEEKEDLLHKSIIKKTFLKTNENFFDFLARQSLADTCGSTAVIALIRDRMMYICWAGDSEATLFKKNGDNIVLCKTHKANSETEKMRIEELGGFIQDVNGVQRLNGILAVTRSFGDSRFKRFVTSEPEIVAHKLDGNEDFLILACDGLWDVMTAKDVGEFVPQFLAENGKEHREKVSEALTKKAIDLNSSDNVSVITIFFDNPRS